MSPPDQSTLLFVPMARRKPSSDLDPKMKQSVLDQKSASSDRLVFKPSLFTSIISTSHAFQEEN